MKNSYFKFVSGAALAVAFSLASCHSVYDVTKVEGRMQPIDSVYDVNPDAEAVALLAPYKAKIDSMMYRPQHSGTSFSPIQFKTIIQLP